MRVFVTRELYPFTAGGIGRVIANMLVAMGEKERRQTAVVYLSAELTEERFRAVYPEVTFVEASYRTYKSDDESGFHYPPNAAAYSNSVLNWESVLAMQALRVLELEHGVLDYIEFPDWGGAAFASTQEKLLGRAFQDTTIAVRLHTTDSVLAAKESRCVDVHALAVYDLERKALADCDLLVAQLPTVAEEMRRFYAFSEEDWNPRVAVHAPPVYLDTREPTAASVVFGPETPIVFSSKIQSIKRPEVFLGGVIEFMRRTPEYKGSAMFLAHAFDPSYLERIKSLIPEEYRSRVMFAGGLQGRPREDLIAKSVCVFPSPWESFCLATYEASMAGAVCVINGQNPAFGDGTPWLDGVNCYKFDGAQGRLAACLGRAFRAGAEPMKAVAHPNDAWPWEQSSAKSLRQHPETLPSATVILVGAGCGADLMRCLEQSLAIEWPQLAVRVLVPSDPDELAVRCLENLTGWTDIDTSVLESDSFASISSVLPLRSDGAEELVVVVDATARFESRFLRDALWALSVDRRIDVVVGQGTLTTADARHNEYEVVHGEARAAGLYENRVAPGIFVARSSQMSSLIIGDLDDYFAMWGALHALACRGARFAVASEIVSVRPRERGISRNGRSPVLGYHDAVAGRRMRIGEVELPLYCVSVGPFGSGATLGGGYDVLALTRELDELRSSESVQMALALTRRIHRFAPGALGFIRRIARPLLSRLGNP